MYAIFESGGHQYAATPNQVVRVEKLEVEAGQEIALDRVLAVRDGDDFKVGTPYLEGAKVLGKALEQGRGPKIIVFKYKPKVRYRRKLGHRQDYTRVRITGIQPGDSQA